MAKVFDCSVSEELLTGMRLSKVALQRGELVVLPTDTVYGIAADAFSPEAVKLLLETKGRGPQSPPPVLIPNQASALALAEDMPNVAVALAEKFWPGALTMIFHARKTLTWNLGETRGTVALRIPNQKVTLALLEEVGPLAVSSANLTGQPASKSIAEAKAYFGDDVATYLDSGTNEKDEPSTIIDLTDIQDDFDEQGNPVTFGQIRIVREGAISLKRIQNASKPIPVVRGKS